VSASPTPRASSTTCCPTVFWLRRHNAALCKRRNLRAYACTNTNTNTNGDHGDNHRYGNGNCHATATATPTAAGRNAPTATATATPTPTPGGHADATGHKDRHVKNLWSATLNNIDIYRDGVLTTSPLLALIPITLV
jgi:hypothetical protein